MKTLLFSLLGLMMLSSLCVAQEIEPSVVLASNEVKLTSESQSPQFMYIRGQMDAKVHYKKYKAARNVTFLSSVIAPYLGIIPAVVSSRKAPRLQNLDFPDVELMKSADYTRGYEDQALKIKQKKLWKSWGIAFGVNVAAMVLIANR